MNIQKAKRKIIVIGFLLKELIMKNEYIEWIVVYQDGFVEKQLLLEF